jgi:hypothetical protein
MIEVENETVRRDPGTGTGSRLAGLRSMAAQADVHIEIQEIPGGTRYAWRVPLDRPPTAAGP